MHRFKALLLLPLVSLLLSGCASTSKTAHSSLRFHEASAANAVLQFSSWEYTFLTQPRYHDNGFLLPVPREKVRQVLDGNDPASRRHGPREEGIVKSRPVAGAREDAPTALGTKEVAGERRRATSRPRT